MSKFTKPEWAEGDPSYIIEPGAGKKAVGWLAGEKPPFQYFNWLHYAYEQWINYFENKTESIQRMFLRSSGTATWDGADLVLSQPLDISYRVEDGEQINRLAAATYSFADGEVLVFVLDKAGVSPITLSADTYPGLGAGEYDIVAESALTPDDQENEVVAFRRKGTTLEIILSNLIFASGATISFGSSSVASHAHAAGDITSGTFADARIAQSNVTQHQAALALAASQITSGTFTDARVAQSNVTQHQAALTILETQITDGSLLARVGGNETISGTWGFSNTILLPDTDPPTAGRMARRSAVRAWGSMDSTGAVQDSFNIDQASSGNTSVGDYDWYFDVNMSNADYAIGCSLDDTAGNPDNFISITGRTTALFSFHSEDNDGGDQDNANSVIICGAQ